MASINWYERQDGIVPSLESQHCVVIGVGAIGRQVAMQLATIGVPKLTLIDYDHVSAENVGNQGFRRSDVGQLKVDCTAVDCCYQNPDIRVDQIPGRFGRHMARDYEDSAIFCCVDSMDSRKFVWESGAYRFFVDGRMNAEIIRIVVGSTKYPETLFPDSERFQPAGHCAARSTFYSANIAAGLMVASFVQFLRGGCAENDVLFNLAAMELSCG